jgi:hypothetical protein
LRERCHRSRQVPALAEDASGCGCEWGGACYFIKRGGVVAARFGMNEK